MALLSEDFIGTPFVLHGRSREHGVDCVGLVAGALEHIGRRPSAPHSYRLRNASIAAHLALAADNGFEPVADHPAAPPCRGDLLLVGPGPAQAHLMIALSARHFVHAHAGLRRVALHSGKIAWPILHHWRLCAPNSEN